MSLLRPTSLRQRLLLISGAITLLTLAVAGTLFVFHDVRMLRAQMVRDLEVLSVTVGENCIAALVFDAPESAEKNLASLRHEHQIRYAVLYDESGQRFAHYQRDPGQPLRDPGGAADGVVLNVSFLGLGTVDVVRGLTFDGREIGRIFIHARMDELAAQVRRYAWVVGGLSLITLAVSLLSALRLQRHVSDPILRLAAKTREISAAGSYALRVDPPGSDDEVASLFRGFNAMLEQIERRERDLQQVYQHLEQLVEDRTRALDTALREQRLILEALPLGVVYVVDRRIARVNPRAVELFGWGEAELVGASTERFYPDREAFEDVGEVAYAHMASGGVYRDDRVLQRRDGSRFWGRLIGQYVDPDHTERGSIWIVEDVDRDKALEEGLRQAREAAERASRAKDAFLANMSHELRTPLNSVMGFAQLLDRDPQLTPGQRRQIRDILRGGERLLGLINDALDLAKIEADRFELVPEEWSSPELLRELGGMFRGRAEQKGIAFRIEPSPALPQTLSCDGRRVHQVLVNLLDNAIKHTEAGAVTLRADYASGEVLLEVADTGAGIPADRRDEIFEPFRQAAGRGQRGQGTGLGLAITKRLVERMGGAITVDSTPGAGSVFRVRIPAQAVAGPSEPGLQARNPAGRVVGYRRTDGHGPLRVLIADDESENREVLRGLLEPLGFTVEEAEGGTACLEKARAFVPDLVLLDLRMPDLDGLAVARTLRELPASCRTPIVAVSAAAFPEDRARALAAGCDVHLAKPVLLDALTQTLGALLPLEWMRREAPAESEGAPELEELSPDRAGQLAALLKTGSISAIRALADDLAREGCCPALARRIAALADDFDLDGLRRLTASGTS